MKITDALLGEHGVFYAQFHHIEQSTPMLETRDEIVVQAELLASALAIHAQLEEELLFQPLDPHIGEMGPLSVMRGEHEEIEGTLDRIPHLDGVLEVREQLVQIVGFARQHFAKEEQVLYPLAEQTLDEERLISLGSEWATRRRVMI